RRLTGVDLLERERERAEPLARARTDGKRECPTTARPLRDPVRGRRAEEARRPEPRALGRVEERVEQRVRQGDRHASHAEIVGREDLELISLGDRDGLDRDELRGGWPRQGQEQTREADGPLGHRHLARKGSLQTGYLASRAWRHVARAAPMRGVRATAGYDRQNSANRLDHRHPSGAAGG